MTLSPSSDLLRSTNGGNQSRSPSEARRRTAIRSSSISKKEHAKESASRSRSTSNDKQQLVSGITSRPSSKDRKSYLCQRASEKRESKGRKSSVLGSLTAFLDEEGSNPMGTRRSRDAQSVISSVSNSRRRQRSHTPSSASVVGLSREELRLQRRSRSNSAGPLDRMMEEKRRSNNSRDDRSATASAKVRSSSTRRRDPSKTPSRESSNRREGRRSVDPIRSSSDGKRKDASRSRTRSSSISTGEQHHHQLVMRTPTKSRSADSLLSGVSGGAERVTRSPGNGAEVPPGFPVAAVNTNIQKGSDLQQSSTILDSTTRLRERQTGHSYNTTNSSGDITSRRRRSIIGSVAPSLGEEKQKELTADSPDTENKRSTLRASKSESIKRGPGRMSRRHSMEMGVVPMQQRKKSISDSEINTDRVSKSDKDIIQSANRAGQGRKIERQRPNRRNQSPATLTKKSPAHTRDKSLDRDERGALDLSKNLSKVNEKKSSNKTSRKGSSQIIANAPANSDRKSTPTERRRLKRNSSKEADTISSATTSVQSTLVDHRSEVKADSSHFDNFHSSVDSLEVDLLVHSPSLNNRVSNVDQLFDDDGKENTGNNEQETLSTSSDSSDDMNHSIISEEDPTRVSWVELPLCNPEQLLVKTTDHDGTNEVSELSSHTRSLKLLDDPMAMLSQKIAEEEKEKANIKKSNPSLQATIDKDKDKQQFTGSQDEKTIVTTTTSTSDATMKTTNKDPAVKKIPAKAKAKQEDFGASLDSMSFDLLDVPERGEQGSSGSISRSSKRRKESSKTSKDSLRSKGSLGSKDSLSESSSSMGKSESKRSSRTTGSEAEKSKDKSKRKEGSSRSRLQKKPSERKEKDKAATKANDVETTVDAEGLSSPMKKSSLESPGTLSRKKSYLNKRKIVKADKDGSKEAKKAVNTSLDTFLQRIEQAAPVVKDDNRSVYSSMQDRDRKRRSVLQKEKSKGKSSGRRFSSLHPRKSLEGALEGLDGGGNSDHDTDSMSITSAPMLRSRSRTSLVKHLKEGSPMLQSQKAVVDLKKTQFSNKLSKLHVAF